MRGKASTLLFWTLMAFSGSTLAFLDSWPKFELPALQASGEEKTVDDFTKLLSGKAAKSKHKRKDGALGEMVFNFYEGGKLIAYTNTSRTDGTWEFNPENKLCLKYSDPSWTDGCHKISINEFNKIIFDNGHRQWFKQID